MIADGEPVKIIFDLSAKIEVPGADNFPLREDVEKMLIEFFKSEGMIAYGLEVTNYCVPADAEKAKLSQEGTTKDAISEQPDVPNTSVGDINKFIDGLEEMFADIRERHVDDSVCGLCEYDGAYVGQSGDWCNECPGFDKDDCFKLSDKTRKKWTEEIIKALPSVQPEERTKTHAETHACDLISRQAAIDGKISIQCANGVEIYSDEAVPVEYLKALQPAQPERRYTEEELKVFQHGISLSLLSKRSSQHWCYDEDTATEIEFLEQLHEKVSADMRGETE